MSETITQDILVTSDYKIFKVLPGNRGLDATHVKQLKRKIEQEGNLTPLNPVQVNISMQVTDGQHRLAALKQLGFPVYYVIQEGMNLATVRHINLGRRNWSWLDYATSYAIEDKLPYQQLLKLVEEFGQGKNVTLTYCAYEDEGHGFNNGDFRISDIENTTRLLNQLREIQEVLGGYHIQLFGLAMYRLMTNTNYDHARMVRKFNSYKNSLKQWGAVKDYTRNIEDIYNAGQGEATRVRLF